MEDVPFGEIPSISWNGLFVRIEPKTTILGYIIRDL